ncbi:MAG: hypothetical protein NUV67_00260 [archaeon]|nr:hypothetical protein [archaeon]
MARIVSPKKSLYTPTGQIKTVSELFRKTRTPLAARSKMERRGTKRDDRRLGPGIDPVTSMGTGKAWMRRPMRAALEKQVQRQLYSGMPPNTRQYIRNGKPREFVQMLAKRNYGSLSENNLKKAYTDAVILADALFLRITKMQKATFEAKALPQLKGTDRERIIRANTLDSFGQIIGGEMWIELFKHQLEKMKF